MEEKHVEAKLMSLSLISVAREQRIDGSEMTQVVTADGFTEMTKVEFFDGGIWKSGGIATIGENAKKPDGSYFTAFLVAGPDDKLVIKTREEIRHPVESMVPDEWHAFLRAGWKIVPSFGACGCRFAWLKPRPSGAHEMYGCISHCTPKDELPSKQGEVSTA
jgi:hypothetical protein